MNVGNDISVHFENLLILEDFFRPLITQLDTIGVVCNSANSHAECAENDKNARKERRECKEPKELSIHCSQVR